MFVVQRPAKKHQFGGERENIDWQGVDHSDRHFHTNKKTVLIVYNVLLIKSNYLHDFHLVILKGKKIISLGKKHRKSVFLKEKTASQFVKNLISSGLITYLKIDFTIFPLKIIKKCFVYCESAFAFLTIFKREVR